MKHFIFLLLSLVILSSCDNDDNGNANANACTFEGATILDLNDNTQTLIPESSLKTDFFPNNDGPGMPAIEVFDTTNLGQTFVVTRAVNTGEMDSNPEIRYLGTDYTGVVTCQRGGSAVGDELLLDVVINGVFEMELCVTIDEVTP